MDKFVTQKELDETLTAKLAPVCKQIENINTGLFNHINHLTANLTNLEKTMVGISKDISWIMRLFDPKEGSVIGRENAKQEANIEWLKWGVTLIVGALVGAGIMYFKK
jgi:hypothetical protein